MYSAEYPLTKAYLPNQFSPVIISCPCPFKVGFSLVSKYTLKRLFAIYSSALSK
jgi:hypothetical protein